MHIYENHSLKNFNTFGVEASAKYFVEVFNEQELQSFLQYKQFQDLPILVLGSGSNILFTKDFDGVILKYSSNGISLQDENEEAVFVTVEGGEVWDDFVKYCVENNLYGVENLSLIPGTVGAAPVQNIGAYGVELKDVFNSLKGYMLPTGEQKQFSKNDCNFGYRNSIFKNELKNKFIITNVTLKLSKKKILNLSYKALADELKNYPADSISLKNIRETVIKIRESKLPDPKVLGNCGSFFKNPEIDEHHFKLLIKKYPQLVFHKLPNDRYKIPAGWLIENSGMKGKRIGNVGTHEKQALVIVNYGGAIGKEILSLAELVKSTVEDKFKIQLEFEVNIL